MTSRHLFLRSLPFLFGLLLGVTGTQLLAVSGGSTRFADVPPGAYYDQAVGDLVDAGIIKGFPDGTFGPGKLVTRADVAVMLNRLRGHPLPLRLSHRDPLPLRSPLHPLHPLHPLLPRQ